MELPTLAQTLVIGSYLFGAAVWGFMYREFKALRREVESLRLDTARQRGLDEGYGLPERVRRLEQALLDR